MTTVPCGSTGVPILDAVARAEQRPSGIKTAPDFDRETLAGLMAAYTKARRAKVPAASTAAHAHNIGAELVAVVTPIYRDIQRAIRVLQGLSTICQPLPGLDHFAQQEADEFAYFMSYPSSGAGHPCRSR
jgi:hypothetical protein